MATLNSVLSFLVPYTLCSYWKINYYIYYYCDNHARVQRLQPWKLIGDFLDFTSNAVHPWPATSLTVLRVTLPLQFSFHIIINIFSTSNQRGFWVWVLVGREYPIQKSGFYLGSMNPNLRYIKWSQETFIPAFFKPGLNKIWWNTQLRRGNKVSNVISVLLYSSETSVP